MKKPIAFLVCILLIISCTSVFAESATFDSILKSAGNSNSATESNDILFDTFCAKFQKLVASWDSVWDISAPLIISNDDDQTQFLIDGVLITCHTNLSDHPITEIAVETGKDSTDWDSVVKSISLVAALEYDPPRTVSERQSLLHTITNRFSDAFTALSLLTMNPTDGDEMIALFGEKATYYWQYSKGKYYLVAKVD